MNLMISLGIKGDFLGKAAQEIYLLRIGKNIDAAFRCRYDSDTGWLDQFLTFGMFLRSATQGLRGLERFSAPGHRQSSSAAESAPGKGLF
jgi:hypothetical protein